MVLVQKSQKSADRRKNLIPVGLFSKIFKFMQVESVTI